MRREAGLAIGMALLIQLAALDAGLTTYSLTSGSIVVTSSADSGPGTLRQALLDARRGDVITFDQSAFPPRSPTTISLSSRLPEIAQGDLAIDASDAGVILDGSGIGKTPVILLLDDISLKVGEGPNLIENGDFGSGTGHWRPWDDDSGATRDLKYNDFHSPPQSYAWSTVAHVGESHAVYDTNDTSRSFAYRAHFWPFYYDSTVWMSTRGNGTAELRLWYKYGGLSVWLHALFPDGHMGNFHYRWFDRSDEWTEGVTSQVVPSGAVGIALELCFNHPEIWANGLSIRSDGNVVRGLQIIGFPQACIALYGGARNNVVGGDRSIGVGPLGQGNLISGEGNIGIGLWDSTTSFNVIKGNYIGTDLSGTAAWGRRQDGIHINGAHHNRIIGNLISGNGGNGVQVFNNNDSSNTLIGNYIGTDASGARGVGNRGQGIYIHQANNIVIGPGNIVAFNGGDGIVICANSMHNTIVQNSIHGNGGNGISVRANSLRNRITRDSIHDNGGNGIWLCNRGNAEIPVPTILNFDLKGGTITGMAPANCTVEIFSDSGEEGEAYEGQTSADDAGFFIYDKGSPFVGPRLTATASDKDGDTSGFSAPTEGIGTSLAIQVGDGLPKTPIAAMGNWELEEFLNTAMTGARSAARTNFEVRSDVKDIESYSTIKSNGDELIALWANEAAVEGDLGINVTLILDGPSNRTVTAIDVLRGFEQRIVTKVEDGRAIVENLLVRDHPLIILISATMAPSPTSNSLSISTPYPEISVKTGRILYFPLIVGNLAGKGMTFHLSTPLVPPGWTTSFTTDMCGSDSTSSLSLGAGGTKALYLVAAPNVAVGVGIYNFTVEARSEEGESRNLTVAVRVTGPNEVDLALSTLLVKARAGEVSALSAVVGNSGTTRLANITLEIRAPSGWQVIQMPDYLDSLEPGESGNVTLMLRPPVEVEAGDYVVGVTCVSDGFRSSELPMTVSVLSSSISSWAAGIVPIVIAAAILIATYLVFTRRQ